MALAHTLGVALVGVHARLVEIPSVWGHRAGNPLANPEDAAFVDAQVTALLES